MFSFGNVLPDTDSCPIGKANVGPCRIYKPPVSGSGFEINPFASRFVNKIQSSLAFLRVRIELYEGIKVQPLYLFKRASQRAFPPTIDHLIAIIRAKKSYHQGNVIEYLLENLLLLSQLVFSTLSPRVLLYHT